MKPMSIYARYILVRLSKLADEAVSNTPDSPDLDPDEYRLSVPDIIIIKEAGRWSILDGFHRVAGMVGWAMGEDVDVSVIKIRAIDVTGTDKRAIGMVAEPGGYQNEMIAVMEAAARR